MLLQREGSQQKMERRKRHVEVRVAPVVAPRLILRTVGFVVRIHQGRHSSPDIKQQLRDMKLIRKYDGVFMHLDAAALAKLQPLASYLAYGYLSFQTVNELIQRRAYTEHGGKRITIDCCELIMV